MYLEIVWLICKYRGARRRRLPPHHGFLAVRATRGLEASACGVTGVTTATSMFIIHEVQMGTITCYSASSPSVDVLRQLHAIPTPYFCAAVVPNPL